MAELTFYTNPMSRGRIVRWMLEEVGVEYRTILVDFADRRALLDVNPMGKVPTLRHGEVVVTEATAICAYLADAFPDAHLAPPPGDPMRGPYYRWLFFAAGPMEAAIVDRALGVVVPPEREGMVGYGTLARVLDAVEGAVAGGGWLAGPDFTTADLVMGASLGWGLAFGTIEDRPAFRAYVARCDARPAAIRASEIDDALMAPRA